MRVFALSDVHVDYAVNKQWLLGLSCAEYQDDILILAGDVTDNLRLLEVCLRDLASKFFRVLFVPGNHELWVVRDNFSTSLEKFHKIVEIVGDCGVSMEVSHFESLSIVPLLSWYDFSFGQPGKKLLESWADFHACLWPQGATLADITKFFCARNVKRLNVRNDVVISFSHFLPRIDVMPKTIPSQKRFLYPVLGSAMLGEQLEKLKPTIHVYGHSHVNRQVSLEGIVYINNAFGYPAETRITKKELTCIYEH